MRRQRLAVPSERPRTGGRSPSDAWIGTVVVVAGFAVVALYARRYPPTWSEIGPLAALAADPGKLVALLQPLAFLAGLNLAAWELGRWAQRILHEPVEGPGADLNVLARLGYGLALLPVPVLALAALHALTWPALFALIVLPASISLAGGVRTLARKRPWSLRTPSLGSTALFGALALALFCGPLLTALGPGTSYDAAVNHLSVPERYLYHNGVWVSPFSVFSLYPGHVHMLYLLALGLSNSVAAKLIHFELGCLAFAIVYRVGVRHSARCAALGVLFLASEPLLLREMAWAYGDLVATFYALLAAVSLLDWRVSRRPALLWRAGIGTGVCLAARYPGGAVLVSASVALALVPGFGAARERAFAFARLVAASVALMLPWLLRNAILTGNPFAPFAQSLFYAPGDEFFSPLALRQYLVADTAIGMGRDLQAYLSLPWNLTFESVEGTYTNSFGFLVSPLHLVAVVAALAALLRRRCIDLAFLLLLSFVFVTMWFAVCQEARHLLPIAGILALLGARSFEALADGATVRGGLLAVAIAGATLCGWNQLDGAIWRYRVALGNQPHEAVVGRDSARAAGAAMRELLSPDDRLLIVAEPRSYLFRGIDFIPWHFTTGTPLFDVLRRATTVRLLRCELAELGVTHVLFSRRGLAASSKPKPVEGYSREQFRSDMARVEMLMNRHGTTIHHSGGVSVVRLEPAPEDCGDD